MNADAFRHLYEYHFAENRALWQNFIMQLSAEQFTRDAGYSHGSVREQLVHLMRVDEVWFCELQNIDPSKLIPTGSSGNRENIRAHWDRIERQMCAYLAALQDEMLLSRPIKEPEEAKQLLLWQVLLQVVNHGTHHRTQLVRLLNDLGVPTTSQDYIFFVYDNPV